MRKACFLKSIMNLIDTNSILPVSVGVYEFDIDVRKIKNELQLHGEEKFDHDPLNSYFEDYKIVRSKLDYTNILLDQIDEAARQWGLRLSNVWMHIQYPDQSTNTHHHQPADTSFVYYVSVPSDSGTFAWDLTGINGPVVPVEVKENTAMFFPGWVPHKVTRNLSKEKRISISGNLDKL
jgi:hypothetical protein